MSRIQQMELEYAYDACTKPSGKEAFDYGRACGRVQGFARVREEITKMLEEDAKREVLKESE